MEAAVASLQVWVEDPVEATIEATIEILEVGGRTDSKLVIVSAIELKEVSVHEELAECDEATLVVGAEAGFDCVSVQEEVVV